MKDFSFYNPTKIEFGIAKERNIGRYMREYGCKKTILLYGSDRIKKDGLFDIVTSSLVENKISFIEFGGIKSNPTLKITKQAIALAKKEGVDSVLAIGGGSVLDCAKAVAAGAKYDGDVWDFCMGKEAKEALKIFDIITLAATGSEMNSGAVITNDEILQKYSMRSSVTFPTLSIINPKLHESVNGDYLAYSACDIIAHSIEAYFTSEFRPFIIDNFVHSNIKTTIINTEILLKDSKNYEARAQFAWAATMALNGLGHVGVGAFGFPNHMLEHAMSAVTDCPHGAGLSVIIPAWMSWYKDKEYKRFEKFALNIFGLKNVDDGIKALKDWFNTINAPTKLSQLNIDDKQLDLIINSAYENSKKIKMDSFYTKDALREIYNLAK